MQGFITTPIEQAIASTEGDRLHDLVVEPGAKHDLGLHPAELRPEHGDDRGHVQGPAGQIPDPEGIQRPGRRPRRTGQTAARHDLGFSSERCCRGGDLGLSVAHGPAGAVDRGGVGSADILGGQTFAMRLWLDPQRMAGAGRLTGEDVAAAIRANNFQSAPGQTKGYFTVANIAPTPGSPNVEQFKRHGGEGQGRRHGALRDIATVELGAQSTDASVGFGGERAMFIGIQATPGQSAGHWSSGVRALLPEIEPNLPPALR